MGTLGYILYLPSWTDVLLPFALLPATCVMLELQAVRALSFVLVIFSGS